MKPVVNRPNVSIHAGISAFSLGHVACGSSCKLESGGIWHYDDSERPIPGSFLFAAIDRITDISLRNFERNQVSKLNSKLVEGSIDALLQFR